MYYLQKGWLVTISKIISYVFIVGISFCLLLYGAGIWFSITEGNDFVGIVSATFFYLLFIVGMAIFVVYNLWRFPNISTSDEGITLRVFFYTMRINWRSVVRTQKKNNRLLIFLGNKGLFFNRLSGLLDAKVWDQPVILFDSSEEMVNRLDEDIKTHLARIG